LTLKESREGPRVRLLPKKILKKVKRKESDFLVPSNYFRFETEL
jgi:hypothetical protein